MQLSDLGWDDYFHHAFEPFRGRSLAALRISRQDRDRYLALGEEGEVVCELAGKLRHEAAGTEELPAVGDWVAAASVPGEKKAVIHALLARKSVFSRKVAGELTDGQVVAANIDTAFIVTGLDLNFNLRRIERYLTLAWNGGAEPVVLLNKADLSSDPETRKIEVEQVSPGIAVHLLSASLGTGLDALDVYLGPGRTVAFLGSSGVGKSSIINALFGENKHKVNEVSDLGSRGRHTTTFRELLPLPQGGVVIDTPGMRELQVWGGEEGLGRAFDDIEELAGGCRFDDCTHENEPGCAVREAVRNGSLDPERLESYFKLKKEYAFLAARQSMKPSALEKARWKSVSKAIKNLKKNESY